MKELQRKQRIKRRLYSLPILALMLIITVFFVHGAYTVMKKEYLSAKYVEDLQAKVVDLSDRQVELTKSTARLETEEGIDEEIKSKFSVSKEGEHVAVIVDRPEAKAATTTTEKPWYKRA